MIFLYQRQTLVQSTSQPLPPDCLGGYMPFSTRQIDQSSFIVMEHIFYLRRIEGLGLDIGLLGSCDGRPILGALGLTCTVEVGLRS